MAAKSAYVHAILNTTGGGEFFTQDVEDMPAVIETAQTLHELKAFAFWAFEHLTTARPDLQAAWGRLKCLHTDAGFVALANDMAKKHPKDE